MIRTHCEIPGCIRSNLDFIDINNDSVLISDVINGPMDYRPKPHCEHIPIKSQNMGDPNKRSKSLETPTMSRAQRLKIADILSSSISMNQNSTITHNTQVTPTTPSLLTSTMERQQEISEPRVRSPRLGSLHNRDPTHNNAPPVDSRRIGNGLPYRLSPDDRAYLYQDTISNNNSETVQAAFALLNMNMVPTQQNSFYHQGRLIKQYHHITVLALQSVIRLALRVQTHT
jgi:hypothetical protein